MLQDGLDQGRLLVEPLFQPSNHLLEPAQVLGVHHGLALAVLATLPLP